MCGIFTELASKELQCWPVLRLGRLFKKLPQICSHRLTVSLPRLMDDPARYLAWVGGRGQEPQWMVIPWGVPQAPSSGPWDLRPVIRGHFPF